MINYHYDKDQGIYELYWNDTLIVELPYADQMTDSECEDLAQKLWSEYLESK
jgi:hypothetical protein